MACQIVLGNTDSLSQAIVHDELDFAICGEPSDPTAFYFEPIYQERIVLVTDHNHPLSGASSVSFKEILDYPVIAGGHTCLYYLQLAKHLSRYETMPPLLNTVSQISAIPYFAKQTLAVGVVLGSTPLIPEVERIDVKWDEPFIPIGLLQPRGRDYPPSACILQAIAHENHQRGDRKSRIAKFTVKVHRSIRRQKI